MLSYPLLSEIIFAPRVSNNPVYRDMAQRKALYCCLNGENTALIMGTTLHMVHFIDIEDDCSHLYLRDFPGKNLPNKVTGTHETYGRGNSL